MFTWLRHWLLRFIYRRFVLGIVVLEEKCRDYYRDIQPFCVIELKTTKGPVIFRFKEDRRSSKRLSFLCRRIITNYIVEMFPSEELLDNVEDPKNNIVVVVRFPILKVDYRILVEVLSDIYLDTSLEQS